MTLFPTLGMFNSDALSRAYNREHTKFQALVPASTKFEKEKIKIIGPVHPYTVYARMYRLLPTPPLPTERQKDIPEVSFNFISSTGL